MADVNEILQVRRRVGDKAKDATETFEYQGQNGIPLSHNNVSNVSVAVNGTAIASTAFTVNAAAGLVTLNDDTASGDDTVSITYVHAAYSDVEIGALIDQYGEKGAVVEILNELLADSAKMFDYSNGATEEKQSQIFKNLKQLLELYTDSSGNVNDGSSSGFAVMHRDIGRRQTFFEPDISRQDC